LGADSTHLRGRLGHTASVVFAGWVLLCLTGCGGGPSTSSFFSSASSLFSSSTKIALAPIVGAPQPVAEQFTQALVVAGKDRHLTILPGGGSANYTLRGYLLASSDKSGSKISYIWDVTDAKGTRVTRVQGDELIPSRTADPWDAVTGTVLNTIAGKTTSQLAASLPHGGGSPAPVAVAEGSPAVTASTAAALRRANGVLVTPVSGAPGDGQRSLTTALKKRLYAGGIKLANGITENVYMVKGSVVMSDASGGKQSIRIDWLVLDPTGRRLGTVSQQNTIPRGSLNGPWGAVADAAAGAAAAGIIKLLPKSS
jgi:hypothetical protein